MPTMSTAVPQAAADGVGDLDALTAMCFLEGEASTLRDALGHPGCGRRLRRALRCQDHSHGSWLALLGEAERTGRTRLARTIAELYKFHGLAAGTLERGFHPLLHPSVERRMRTLLIARLQRLTARAVDCLAAEAAAPAPFTTSRPSARCCVARRQAAPAAPR